MLAGISTLCYFFFPIRRKWDCSLHELKDRLPAPRTPELAGRHRALGRTRSYPALRFYGFDEWGATHGLGLDHVIIEQ